MFHFGMAKRRTITFFLKKSTACTKSNYEPKNDKQFYCFSHDVKVRIRIDVLDN